MCWRKDTACSYGEQPTGRWAKLIAEITLSKQSRKSQHDTLTSTEIDALFDGLIKARRKAFDDSIMRELLTDETELSYSIAKAPIKLKSKSAGITVTV